MAETSGIAWTRSTWNPWRGCQRVSEGCANCYAETFAKRNPGTLGTWGPDGTGTRVVGAEKDWERPAAWNNKARTARPWRVFCASLADIFEDWRGRMLDHQGRALWVETGNPLGWHPDKGAPDWAFGRRPVTMADVRARVFRTIEQTLNLTWLLLTKRPANVLRMVPVTWLKAWPRNVHIGTTAETQARYAERLPELRKIPAPVRFVSIEPQLGRIDLDPIDRPDWIICGGESGPRARPFAVEWARTLRDQARRAGIPFFMKQMGRRPTGDYYRDREHFEARGHDWPDALDWNHRDGQPPIGSRVALPLLDLAGADVLEWPEDLRVQEFPPCG